MSTVGGTPWVYLLCRSKAKSDNQRLLAGGKFVRYVLVPLACKVIRRSLSLMDSPVELEARVLAVLASADLVRCFWRCRVSSG
jgi:hypothetical protein